MAMKDNRVLVEVRMVKQGNETAGRIRASAMVRPSAVYIAMPLSAVDALHGAGCERHRNSTRRPSAKGQ